jgi:hypothetical protein
VPAGDRDTMMKRSLALTSRKIETLGVDLLGLPILTGGRNLPGRGRRSAGSQGK